MCLHIQRGKTGNRAHYGESSGRRNSCPLVLLTSNHVGGRVHRKTVGITAINRGAVLEGSMQNCCSPHSRQPEDEHDSINGQKSHTEYGIAWEALRKGHKVKCDDEPNQKGLSGKLALKQCQPKKSNLLQRLWSPRCWSIRREWCGRKA